MARTRDGATLRRAGAGARRAGRTIVALSVLGLAPLLLACAPKIPVHVDASSRPTLAGYRTYAWVTPPPDKKSADREPQLDVFDWQIESTAQNALAGKGFIRNDRAPDMLVMLRVDVDEKNSETLGEYFYYRDAGGTKPLFSAFSLGYEQTTITIEAVDASNRALLWRGRTAVAMDAPHRDRRAIDSVLELLKAFPTQQG